MNSLTYIQNQLTNIDAIFRHIVGDLMEDELVIRPAKRQNMIGYTVWHMPRTQDAHIQTWIRGVPEIVHGERWSHWQPLRHLGYGTGISLDEADEIARSIRIPEVLEYAGEVHLEITTWLQDLDESELDQIPDISKHLSQYPEYQTESLLREVGDLVEQPIWGQLMRPCIGHIHRHLGELEIIKEIIRTDDES